LQSRKENEDDSKQPTIDVRSTRLEMIWNDLPQKHVVRVVQNFRKPASTRFQGWRTL